ncbi:MAG: T9SS type A sorting domain-containing protein [Bacteroidales bacterium]
MTSRGAAIFLSFILLFPALLTGQISQPGSPPSFSKHSIAREVPSEQMVQVDVRQLLTDDQLFDDMKDVPWRFGDNIAVDLHPENSGRWDLLPDGSRLWRLGISSAGAYTLNLTFDRYRLPAGAELYVYNADRSVVLGAFTDFNNQEDGYFATTLVPGDHVFIEYWEPARAAFPGELSIGTVTHAYRDPYKYAKDLGDSGWCNLNVACEEAQGWDSQINAVVLMVSGSNAFCTGTFVNNTSNDETPYLLSANHCYKDPSTVVVWFNWQSVTCENPSESPLYDAMSGAVDRAKNADSDVWLLEMNQSIPDSYRPFFAGWNRTMDTLLQGTFSGIHHPRGDIKKFSYALEGVAAADYLGEAGSGNTHWRIVWSGGTTTEAGSSGSALFDAERRLVGQLHGGYAACNNTEPDWYGRFGTSWDNGSDAATRLRDWLDPLGLNPMVWDGLRHNIVLDSSPPDLGQQTGSGTYDHGYELTINTTVPQGYIFQHWADNETVISSNTTHSFQVTADRHLTAVFQPEIYDIVVTASPGQAGTVSGGGSFEFDAQVTVQAKPQEGWAFKHWEESGTVVSSSNSYSFQVSGHRTLTAMFEPRIYDIMVSADPGQAGTVSGAGSYEYGTEVTVEAWPQEGWDFVHWEENGIVVSASSNFSFQVIDDRSLTALFQPEVYNVVVVADPDEAGTVSGGGVYEWGSEITLEAQAGEGWIFSHWSESGTEVWQQPAYNIVVTSARELVAHFVIQTFQITLEVEPAEGGTVSGAGTYEYNQTATLTAHPATGWQFRGWEEHGAIVSSGNPLEYEVKENRQLIARMEPDRMLTIGMQGEGTTDPVTGTHTFPWGSMVSLNAVPATGWLFSRWEVNGQTLDQTSIEVEMNEDVTAMVFFLDATSDGLVPFEQQVSVYPSPASEALNVRLTRADGLLNIVLLNLSGQQVRMLQQAVSTRSEYQVTLNLNGVPAGVYLLKIALDHQTVHKKIIIY